MKVSFYLLNKKEQNSSLMFNISYAGKQIKLSTKIVIPTDNFNYSRQMIVKHKLRLELNQKLNTFKSKIEKHCIDNEPSISELKEFVTFLRDGMNENGRFSDLLLINFNDFLEERKKAISKSYYIKLEKLYRHLQDYQKHIRKTLKFSDMNESFRSDFLSYLTINGLRNNTANVCLKSLKTFLHWTIKRKRNSDTSFIYDFHIKTQDTSLIALTEKELSLLENIALQNKKLNIIRDLFLIQTYTGLRYSDLINLKEGNFDIENKRILITQIKTQDTVIIPIHSKLLILLEKYNYQIARITNVEYNIKIKDICKQAGIDDIVQVVYYRDKQRIEESKPKYEFISTHTARRTFITISLKKGLLPETVMKVSGHKDRKSFQKYVRIAQEEAVESIRKIWD